jgi:hypothetical protein
MNTVEIYFRDLSDEKQAEILQAAGIDTEEDGNWDVLPLAVVDFEPEDDNAN